MTPTMIIMAMSRKMTFMSMACMASSKLMILYSGKKVPASIGHRQHQGRPQEGRQRPVHQLEGNEAVDGQQHQRGHPEARCDGPGHLDAHVRKVDGGTLPIVFFLHDAAQGETSRISEGCLFRLDLHDGPGKGPRRQGDFDLVGAILACSNLLGQLRSSFRRRRSSARRPSGASSGHR